MRIRVIVEDDEGEVIGEGSVPISVLPDANREMLDALREIAKQMRESQPYVPVYPEPYIPQYPQPWQPIGPYYDDPWYYYRYTVTTSDRALLDSEGNTDPPPQVQVWCRCVRPTGFGPCGGWNHDIEDPK